MPMIHYACACGNTFKTIVRRKEQIAQYLVCDKCQGVLQRQLSVPSSTSKISIDNGVQARAVEIMPDIIEINEERSKKNLRED